MELLVLALGAAEVWMSLPKSFSFKNQLWDVYRWGGFALPAPY